MITLNEAVHRPRFSVFIPANIIRKILFPQSDSHDDVKSKLSHAEESLAKLEAEKTELADKLGQISDSAKAKDKEIETLTDSKEEIAKENAKLKEKLKVVEDAGSSSGKSDKEKDAIIAVSNFQMFLLQRCGRFVMFSIRYIEKK